MDSFMYMDSHQEDAAVITLTTEASSFAIKDTAEPSNIVSMDKFYPALVQCFGIIICGYIAGRYKIISNAETKGLGTFVGTFALPSLIFVSLVELDWRTVNWTFLLAILISKAIVFAIVIMVTLLIGRSLELGRAGLLGIFCTQSNDFAIGYPIVEALYQNIHPEYASYLYLLSPISLAVLNPIGLVLMEITIIMRTKNDVAEIRIPSCPSPCTTDQLPRDKRFISERVLLVLNMIRSLFFNPLLLMTVLGVVGGVLFPSGLPETVASVLRVFGQSFSATALFLLGLKIVGQGRSLRGSGFLLPIILILIKILVLPLVSRQTVNIMQAGQNFNDTTELSTYAFLYGTFPAAPGAFVIASQYNCEVELIAKSMVLCTFISAPLMFISAKMISLTNLNPVDFLNELDAFAFDISIAGLVAGIWVLLLLITTKSYRRVPHRVTCCLVLSQLMTCTAVVFWSKSGSEIGTWKLYLQYFLFSIGTYSSWLWTSTLAMIMLFLHCRSLCFVLKLWRYMLILAWGVPIIITILLIFIDQSIVTGEKHNPNAHYGTTQTAISVFLLVTCFIVTVGCLVLLQRNRKRSERLTQASTVSAAHNDLQSSISTANLLSHINEMDYGENNRNVLNKNNRVGFSTSTSSSSDDDDYDNVATVCNRNGVNNNACCSVEKNVAKAKDNRTITATAKALVDIEDLLTSEADEDASRNACNNDEISELNARSYCNSGFTCGENPPNGVCPASVLRYEDQANKDLEPLENNTDDDEHQSLRHTLLLIMLLCSMIVSLSVCIWTLVMDGMSGIYMELSFLDVFLNFGQSVIVLAIFISETSELLTPFMRVWRYIWYGANVLTLPPRARLSTETEHICEQFRNYHLDNCKKVIANDRRWRIKVYRQVFYGTEFVDWLIEVGLSKDRIEAINYARHLIDGRVLCHINNAYHFQDTKLLYKFCNRF